MRLVTYLYKKATGKLNNKLSLVKPNETINGFGSAQCDGKWGELNENIIIDKHIEARDSKSGGGWTLIINNYTKCDVPSHIDWDMQFYEDVDSGDVYVRSQTKEEIYFLFWVVATLYSFDTWVRLPKEFFNNTTTAIKNIFEFTDHGAANGHGITMNSRIYIDRKNLKDHYVQLGNVCRIQGCGRNDEDLMIVNF